MEKCLWAEINALGTEEKPCFASNAYLAKMFNSTESSIANIISKLKSFGMVKHLSYDGRCRRMVAVLPIQTSPTSEVRVHPQVKSDFTHRLSIDTNIVSKRELPLPPHGVEVKKPKSKPVDSEFINSLKKLNPRIDVDAELTKMETWLLANPSRQKTRKFVSGWINRCAEKLPPIPKQETFDDIDWANVKPNQ